MFQDRIIIQSGYYAFRDRYGNSFIGELNVHPIYECWFVYPPTRFAPKRTFSENIEYDGQFFLLNEVEFLTDILTTDGFSFATKERLEELNSLYLFDKTDKATKAYGVAA